MALNIIFNPYIRCRCAAATTLVANMLMTVLTFVHIRREGLKVLPSKSFFVRLALLAAGLFFGAKFVFTFISGNIYMQIIQLGISFGILFIVLGFLLRIWTIEEIKNIIRIAKETTAKNKAKKTK